MSGTLLIAVLPIILSPEQRVTASEVYRLVADAAELRPSLRVLSLDQTFFQDGGELVDRALACGSDTACIARQLAPSRAQLGVVVIANLELDPPLLSILLLDTGEETTIAEATGPVRAAELGPAIFARTSALFDRAGHPRAGRLVVEVEPSRAVVAIEGARPDLGESNRFTLRPGTYEIVASLEGFEPRSTTAQVNGGETATVSLVLAEETSILDSPWFWIAGSAVIVAAGATAAALTLGGRERCICVLTADGRDCSVCR